MALATLLLPTFDPPTRYMSSYLKIFTVPKLIRNIRVQALDLIRFFDRRSIFRNTTRRSNLVIGCGHGDACYSEDTEILTENGWKYFFDLCSEDKIAILNPKTDELEYHKMIRFYKFPYSGKMFYQRGKHIDLLVTPNHNLYCCRLIHQYGKGAPFCSPFMFIKPEELGDGAARDPKTGQFISTGTTKTHLGFKRSGKWSGTKQDFFVLPPVSSDIVNQTGYCTTKIRDAIKINMDDWLRFFGIWIAEGCTNITTGIKRNRKGVKKIKCVYYRITITQNDDKKREIIRGWVESVCKQIGCSYWEHKNPHSRAFEIRNKQLYMYLKQFGKAHDKFIPNELKKLSYDQLKLLFDAMVLGDGCCNNNNICYSTASRKLIDDIQEIALKMNLVGVINKTRSGFTNKYTIYTINISNRINPLCGKQYRGYTDYNGIVYSVEVPNHIVFVRRRGKPCWSGNSTMTGQHLEVLWEVGKYDKIECEGKIIKLISCECGTDLGPDLINNGARAFQGYTKIFSFYVDMTLLHLALPCVDFMARKYLIPPVKGINALIGGKTNKEAYEIEYQTWQEMIDAETDPEMKAIMENNQQSLVMLGDPDAHI